MIYHGDCLDVMATLDAESIAAIVTDPPYGLGFMGKAWDGTAGPGGLGDMPMRRNAGTNIVNTGVSRQGGRQRSTDDFAKRQARDARSFQDWCETWAVAAFRVAKPGAHLLAFGGTRTYHRLASAIEDAGWEIRDCLVWGYASGFPKSHNLDGEWDGWGTALKPAWEPIVMARKPLRGTVAANVAVHGTGALNIDGARIPFAGDETTADREGEATATTRYTLDGGTNLAATPGRRITSDRAATESAMSGSRNFRRVEAPGLVSNGPTTPDGGYETQPGGRWPANVILTDPIFDGGIEGVVGGGETSSSVMRAGTFRAPVAGKDTIGNFGGVLTERDTYGDSGTYSRFFLIPKADRSEREPFGLAGFDAKREMAHRRTGDMDTPYLRGETQRRNTHPTVKQVDLMRHLVRLVTPPGGTVLDPFLGSGTTAIAAEMEGFAWIGIEREAEYVAIANARLEGVQKGMGLAS